MQRSVENKFVLELCKITGAFDVDFLVATLSNQNICWPKILEVSTKNKILGLIYNNISKLGLKDYILHTYESLISDSICCDHIRNQYKLQELKSIQKLAFDNGISMAVVKGGYLIDNVYKDRRIRKTNDMDMLIKRKDISFVHNLMLENGYQYGEYDKKTM